MGIAWLAGWLNVEGSLRAGALAAASWILPALPVGVLLVLVAGRDVARLGPAVLALSFLRMLGAIGVGLVLTFVIKPELKTFWIVFLGAGLCCLAAETLWTVRTLNRACGPDAGDHSPTPHADHADHAGSRPAARGLRTDGIGA